ncbi:exo-beta-N-acetylmuramidase NamZ domain-containing protein [Streptomyces griseoluteus]|uniref:exo-beta-N-acetylmuramidase NamZ family protein n=1 Tax=Streptomyces griseoluteus TaxID=29306 RepID=UPI0036DFA76D
MSSADDRFTVTPGIARLCAVPGLAGPGRLGLVTNHTCVLPDLSPTAPALMESGVHLAALFGPEHGLYGTAQAGGGEPDETDPATGLPVYDTYRREGDLLDKVLIDSGVDALVYDLQDVGARFYTYVWTMFDLMVSAARTGVRFVVADRPNPLGGLVSEGPVLDPAFASFVGRAPVPIRHGLTCGELAWFLNRSAVADVAGRQADLTVIKAAGWQRGMDAEATGLPWIAPSPNMPTFATAVVYPGTCLFEGTNVSEGRGTTQPFQSVGAPYIDARFAPALAELGLPGVHFREVRYVPTFGKHAGRPVRGVHLHVMDREAFAPVRTAVAMLGTLRRLYPDDFAWSGDFIDRLWGSAALRRTVDAGEDPTALVEPPAPPGRWAGEDVLLYP